MKRIPIAVIGAGLIGRTHVDRALRQPRFDLVGVADPSEDGRRVAESAAVAWFSDFERMLATVKPPTGTQTRAVVATRAPKDQTETLREHGLTRSREITLSTGDLLLTYTESIPWWTGVGHYNRWGPNAGCIAPFGKERAELVFDRDTSTMDGSPVVLWMNVKKYIHYTDYETAVMMDARH